MNKPKIICEIGVNHENNMELAKRMISECKDLAWAVKFQYYKADLLASPFAHSYWKQDIGQNEYFHQYDKWGIDEYKELSEFTHSQGLQFIVTPFHLEAVDELEPYVDWYKVASSDITNLQLIDKIATKNKPILISSGGATETEIIRAKLICDCVMMHCILDYPAGNVHLERIKNWYIQGYSDHSIFNLELLTTAWLLGAEYIEKHYTYDKTLQGNDHYHAMDKYDLVRLNQHFDKILKYITEPNDNEDINKLQARRSLFYKTDLPEGHILKSDDLICLRPGTFIPADQFYKVSGRKLTQDVEKYSPVLTDDLEVIWK
jgi:sialic acid synthase SpsE